MSRTYSPQSTVALPITTAKTCFALSQKVIDTILAEKDRLEAQGQTLPQFLWHSSERLIAAHDALGVILTPVVNAELPSTREADSQLDAAWGSIYDLLNAWNTMDPSLSPDVEGVRALIDLLFAEGKAFLNLDFHTEWVESDRRLVAVKQSPYIDTIGALGAMQMLEGVERAHEAYGRALGITDQHAPKGPATLRDTTRALQAQLREFVVKTMAWSEPNNAGSEELSKALLYPLESWTSPSPSSSSATAKDESLAPEVDEAEAA